MDLSVAKNRYYNLINSIVNNNKISHAYLIEVDNYDTDYKCIMDFVKMIICNSNDAAVNDMIDSGNYPDLKIIEPDGNSIKKSQLIKLQEDFRNKSFLNNRMIYIIKEADKLNDSSGNTILKFLEEPEDDIVGILVTTNRYKVIDTILSRCQVISIQDGVTNSDCDEIVLELLKFIIKKDDLFINYQYISDNILVDKHIAKDVLSRLENILLQYLNYYSDKNVYCDNKVISILSNISTDKLIRYIAVIEEEVKKFEFNINYKLWLDSFFAKLIEV